MSDTTVEYNGQEADLYSPEARELVGKAVRGALGRGHSATASDRQSNMMVQHLEMDEHVQQVQVAMSALAEKLAEGSTLAIGFKTPIRVTRFGELLDATLTIKVDAKPPKAEK